MSMSRGPVRADCEQVPQDGRFGSPGAPSARMRPSSPQRGQTPPWRPSGVLKRKLSTEVGKCDIMAPDLWAAHASPAPWGGSTPRRRPPAPAAASFDAPAAFAAPMPAAGTRTPAGEQLRPRVPARGAGLGPASPAPAPAPAARPTSAPAARPAVAGAQWDAPRPSAERPFGPRATPRVHPTVDIPPRPSTAGGGPSPAATPAWATSLWRSLASPLSRTAGLRAMSSERSFQVSWGSGMLPSFLSGRERRFGEGLREATLHARVSDWHRSLRENFPDPARASPTSFNRSLRSGDESFSHAWGSPARRERSTEYVAAHRRYASPAPPSGLTVPLRGSGPFHITGQPSLVMAASKREGGGMLERFEMRATGKVESVNVGASSAPRGATRGLRAKGRLSVSVAMDPRDPDPDGVTDRDSHGARVSHDLRVRVTWEDLLGRPVASWSRDVALGHPQAAGADAARPWTDPEAPERARRAEEQAGMLREALAHRDRKVELLRRQVEEQQRVIKEAMAQLEERDVECSMLLQELARARYGAPAGAQAAQGGNRSRSVPRGTPAGDASAGASARVSADAARAAATPEASAARVGTLGGECGAARGGRAAVFLVDTSVSDAAVDRTDNTDGGEESVAFMDVSVEGDGSPRLHEVASQAASPVNRAGEVSEISPETASTSPVQRGLVSEEEAVRAMEAAVDQSRLEQMDRSIGVAYLRSLTRRAFRDWADLGRAALDAKRMVQASTRLRRRQLTRRALHAWRLAMRHADDRRTGGWSETGLAPAMGTSPQGGLRDRQGAVRRLAELSAVPVRLDGGEPSAGRARPGSGGSGPAPASPPPHRSAVPDRGDGGGSARSSHSEISLGPGDQLPAARGGGGRGAGHAFRRGGAAGAGPGSRGLSLRGLLADAEAELILMEEMERVGSDGGAGKGAGMDSPGAGGVGASGGRAGAVGEPREGSQSRNGQVEVTRGAHAGAGAVGSNGGDRRATDPVLRETGGPVAAADAPVGPGGAPALEHAHSGAACDPFDASDDDDDDGRVSPRPPESASPFAGHPHSPGPGLRAQSGSCALMGQSPSPRQEGQSRAPGVAGAETAATGPQERSVGPVPDRPGAPTAPGVAPSPVPALGSQSPFVVYSNAVYSPESSERAPFSPASPDRAAVPRPAQAPFSTASPAQAHAERRGTREAGGERAGLAGGTPAASPGAEGDGGEDVAPSPGLDVSQETRAARAATKEADNALLEWQVLYQGIWRVRARKIIRMSREVLLAWHDLVTAGPLPPIALPATATGEDLAVIPREGPVTRDPVRAQDLQDLGRTRGTRSQSFVTRAVSMGLW